MRFTARKMEGIQMNVLVIFAHPNPKSLNAAILKEVERTHPDGL
jgi:hypothetical protein